MWKWACIMTPVGIVGSWGMSCYGGWIWYVFSGFIFCLLNHILSSETCLAITYSRDVFQNSLYLLRQAKLTPKSSQPGYGRPAGQLVAELCQRQLDSCVTKKCQRQLNSRSLSRPK